MVSDDSHTKLADASARELTVQLREQLSRLVSQEAAQTLAELAARLADVRDPRAMARRLAAKARHAATRTIRDMQGKLAGPRGAKHAALAAIPVVGMLAVAVAAHRRGWLPSKPAMRLRERAGCPIAGGETVTTAAELRDRLTRHVYDIAQPDATVVGGICQLIEVFAAAAQTSKTTAVHCWGGAVCLMANYHTALAASGTLAEWPLPWYPLRDELLAEPLRIENGCLLPPADRVAALTRYRIGLPPVTAIRAPEM
jgi:Enolase C-terminal domain-like